MINTNMDKDSQLIWETLNEAGHTPPAPGPAGSAEQPGGSGPWDSQGKSLQEGDIVTHGREDGEWIVISVEPGQRADQGTGQIQLAELGEGIVADAKDVTIVGSPYGSTGQHQSAAIQAGEEAQKRRPTSYPNFDEPSFGTDYE